jgi:hypothetical protein
MVNFLVKHDAQLKEHISQLQEGMRALMSQNDSMRKSMAQMQQTQSPEAVRKMLLENPSLFYNPEDLKVEISEEVNSIVAEYASLSLSRLETAISGSLAAAVLDGEKQEKKAKDALVQMKEALIRSRAVGLAIPILKTKLKAKQDKKEFKKTTKKQASKFLVQQQQLKLDFEKKQQQDDTAAYQDAMDTLMDNVKPSKQKTLPPDSGFSGLGSNRNQPTLPPASGQSSSFIMLTDFLEQASLLEGERLQQRALLAAGRRRRVSEQPTQPTEPATDSAAPPRENEREQPKRE